MNSLVSNLQLLDCFLNSCQINFFLIELCNQTRCSKIWNNSSLLMFTLHPTPLCLCRMPSRHFPEWTLCAILLFLRTPCTAFGTACSSAAVYQISSSVLFILVFLLSQHQDSLIFLMKLLPSSYSPWWMMAAQNYSNNYSLYHLIYAAFLCRYLATLGLSGNLVVKNLPASAGDTGPIPGLGRSPGGGNSNPLQYSCLVNPKDRGAWQATIHGVTENWTWLSMHNTPPY